jgi:hypothetical protein
MVCWTAKAGARKWLDWHNLLRNEVVADRIDSGMRARTMFLVAHADE